VWWRIRTGASANQETEIRIGTASMSVDSHVRWRVVIVAATLGAFLWGGIIAWLW
jgi:hypothetical protein